MSFCCFFIISHFTTGNRFHFLIPICSHNICIFFPPQLLWCKFYPLLGSPLPYITHFPSYSRHLSDSYSISTVVYSLVFTFGHHLKRSNCILCLIHRVLPLSYLHLAQLVSFLGNSRSHTHTNLHHQVTSTQWRWRVVFCVCNTWDTGTELATSRNQMSFSQHLYPVGQRKVVHIEIVYLKTWEIYLRIVL